MLTALWSHDAIIGLMDRLDGSMTDRKLIGDRWSIAVVLAWIGSGTVLKKMLEYMFILAVT